jgi:hypothetical protein
MWQMKDSNVQIAMVGKRLVHYKNFKGLAKRAALSIASIPVLEKYLEENEAILIQSAPPPVPVAAPEPSSRRATSKSASR